MTGKNTFLFDMWKKKALFLFGQIPYFIFKKKPLRD